MLKKTVVILIAFIILLSTGYVLYSKTLYASNNYQAGGSVTGRVNIAPNGIAGNNIGMQKGDKIYIGANNPYTNRPMGWQLLHNDQNYPTYNVTVNGTITSLKAMTATLTQTGTANAWFAMTTENVGKDSCFSGTPTYHSYNGYTHTRHMSNLTEYTPYNTMVHLESEMQRAKQVNLIRPADLSVIQEVIIKAPNISGSGTIVAQQKKSQEQNGYMLAAMMKDASIFLPDRRLLTSHSPGGISITGGFHMTSKDLTYNEKYLVAEIVNASDDSTNVAPFSGGLWSKVILADGTDYRSYSGTRTGRINASTPVAFRGASMLNMDEVVFAVSPGNTNAVGIVKEPTLPSNYTNIYTSTANYNEMKLRLYNSANPISVQLTDILHRNGHSVSTVEKNSTLKIKAKAENRNTTVSVLLFKDGNFVYYRPLDIAKGDNQDYLYDFDTTGIDVGTYQFAIVNEEYDDSTTAPAYSSYLSDVMPLTIVEPLSNLTFTPQTDLEFSKNVNSGDQVGMISSNNGVGTITYSIIEDTAYPNEYQSVTLANDGKTVIVNEPSLNVGTYLFKIQARDANGDPNPNLEIAASITVKKTNLSVSFNDPNQTKKSITQAQTGWSEFATATPNTGVKTTYTIVSTQGNINTSDIVIDPDTGDLTYSGNGAYGKITIQASVDDDPNTGKDNYNSASTTKEIVIYRAVDGSVTPDAQSSDANIPTYRASDANAKPNGTIATVKGTLGTPDDGVSGTITYTYELKQIGDFGSFEINPNTGVLKSKVNLGVKDHQIMVIVKDHWSEKEIPLTIKIEEANAEDLRFYENSNSNTVINTKSVNYTDTNVSVFADVKGSTNTNPVTYSLKAGEPTNVIDVNPTSGGVTIKGTGTVIIVATKQGVSGQADAKAELSFTVSAGSQNFIYTDSTLVNELPKSGNGYEPYSEVYGKGKTFQVYTSGNPPGSIVTYALKAGSPTDVITVDPNGTVHIWNASLNTQMGKVIIEATSHDSNGNYSDKTIELPITIKKAEQTISFADVTYAISGSGKVTPVINAQDISSNDGGVSVNDTNYYISVDTAVASGIAWTNDGINIEYNYSGDNGMDIPLHVEKQGNRNYNKATADGQMRIMGPDESSLSITVPGRIIYGDHFTLSSLQDDSLSTNVQYQFEVDNTTYISNPIVNGNQAEFDALKYSGNTMIKIKVTRTADGEIPLSKTVSVKVLPKDINITIDNQTKRKGEQNPTFTYQDFSNQLVNWNGVKDNVLPGDLQLSSTAKDTSPTGDYPITGNANILNTKYPNYNFSFSEGTLTITDEAVDDTWYHLELNDGNHTPYSGDWTNQDVNIVSDHQEYTELSDNQTTWYHNQITISKEGSYNQSFWMKKSNTGAITKEKQAKIQIDKQAPKIKSIVGSNGKKSRSQSFKPGMVVTIQAIDTTLDPNTQISGVYKTTYEIIKLDEQGKPTGTPNKVDQNDDTVEVSLKDAGTYEICATATDHASNESEETCERVTIRSWGESSDDKELPDINIDIDGDGIPDINITRPGEKKPYLNIDTNGDGIPDINISKDGEEVIPGVTKPYLNIMDPSVPWNPTKEIDYDGDGEPDFRTDPNLSAILSIDSNNDRIPDLNIDLDGDYIADININVNGDKKAPQTNIDTDGDGKPDINIDIDGDGKPDSMIATNIEWNPTHMVKDEKGNVIYGTTLNIKPDEKDSITDQGIIVKPSDPNVKFYANTELKVIDITKETESEYSNILTTINKGKVEKVYEIQLLVNGEITEPEGKIEVSIPCDTEQVVHLMKKNKDGTWTEVNYERKGNYLVIITDTLGQYSIVTETTHTSVQGTYTPNIGGADTGDKTNSSVFIGIILLTLGIISYLLFKLIEQKDTFQ